MLAPLLHCDPRGNNEAPTFAVVYGHLSWLWDAARGGGRGGGQSHFSIGAPVGQFRVDRSSESVGVQRRAVCVLSVQRISVVRSCILVMKQAVVDSFRVGSQQRTVFSIINLLTVLCPTVCVGNVPVVHGGIYSDPVFGHVPCIGRDPFRHNCDWMHFLCCVFRDSVRCTKHDRTNATEREIR